MEEITALQFYQLYWLHNFTLIILPTIGATKDGKRSRTEKSPKFVSTKHQIPGPKVSSYIFPNWQSRKKKSFFWTGDSRGLSKGLVGCRLNDLGGFEAGPKINGC